MTVNKLIKMLSKFPKNAKVAVDISYNDESRNHKDWTYEIVDLNPKFEPQVGMHPDWHENRQGKPRNIDMVILGTIVGNYLE